MRWVSMLLVVACGGSPEPASAPAPAVDPGIEQPDLALLLVAGLRSSAVGADGASEALAAQLPTPSADSASLYVQSSVPFSSVGSILTGRYPGAIPLCNRLLASAHKKTESQQAWCARIPDGVHTAAGMLGIYGYKSLLVSSRFPGADALAAGYTAHVEVDAWSEVPEAVSGWWSEAGDGPRFVTVLLGDDATTVLGQAGLARFPEHRLQWLETVSRDVARVTLDPAEVRAQYRAGAGAAGQVLGSVLGTVRGGATRPAYAIVASTSGMSLDERSGFGDAPVPLLTDNIVLDRTLRVPMWVYGPSATRIGAARILQGLDILPTLADWAGAVVPAGAAGRPISSGSGDEAYAEFGDMIALRSGAHLLVFRCSLHNSTALDPAITEQLRAPISSVPRGHYALYDVTEDPLQARNLRLAQPETVARLRARMLEIRTGAAAPPAGTLTPQRLWDLRMAPSEGYW
jgi:hypothetical protein